jgi:hypothetical protein
MVSAFVESRMNGCISLAIIENRTAKEQLVAARSVPIPSSGRIAINKILRYLDTRIFIFFRANSETNANHKISKTCSHFKNFVIPPRRPVVPPQEMEMLEIGIVFPSLDDGCFEVAENTDTRRIQFVALLE